MDTAPIYEPIGELQENFMIIPNLNAKHKKIPNWAKRADSRW